MRRSLGCASQFRLFLFHRFFFAMAYVWLWLPGDLSAAVVTAEKSEQGAVICVDGKLFAEYRTLSDHQPVLWPLIGPTGQPVTRSFPLGPFQKNESKDHPHHHSLWISHQNVNGHDFWANQDHDKPLDERVVIKHLRFAKIGSEGDQAVLVTHNLWQAGKDHPVCEDERIWVFGADANSRWVDCTIRLIAAHGEVTFGDAKDGFFSMRVAGSMKVDAQLGGQIVNSRGQTNKAAWGMPAEWVDYTGPLDGKTVGIAIFSHPSNFQHPCRWHVRNYGLFTANPFGEKPFPPSNITQQEVTLPASSSLTLRYRILLHTGDTKQGRVRQAYQKYAASKTSGLLPVLLDENFEQGAERWTTTDRKQEQKMWSIQPRVESDGKEAKGSMFRVAGIGPYRPPYRSPKSLALLKDFVVSDFQITADMQNTNGAAGDHRDLCVFWGYQDPAHFYYVHLGAKPDPYSCQIFVVNGAPRAEITQKHATGIPWADGWHRVRVCHDTQSGRIEVFFDDMKTPMMTAQDKTFSWGRVGIGTFDDHGNFDNIRLRGRIVQPIPAAAAVP